MDRTPVFLPAAPIRPYRSRLIILVAGLLAAPIAACGPAPDSPQGIVEAAIARHGGDLFEDSRIRFDFRGTSFEFARERGTFRYQRAYRDPLGRGIVEVMDNAGTRKFVNGEEVTLDAPERARVELDVNSVVYFAFLPFRLRDPAVRLRDLGPEVIDGTSYHRIEVTFDEEGGGADADARFIHWIHQTDHTLDYFAYQYSRDGGGSRFRRAVNRREVGGLLLQDFENYGPSEPIAELADFAQRWQEGTVNLLSVVAIENVEVTRASPGRTDSVLAPPPPAPTGADGLEIQLGIDRAAYGPGMTMQVALRLVNRATEARQLEFPTSQRFDLEILDEEGATLTRWSADQVFLQVLGTEILDPEEALEFEATLTAPDRPGEFHIAGGVPTDGTDLRALVPFRVEP